MNKDNASNEKPSYFSYLTAEVRYDKSITANEKILYSEITCLSNKFGYCTATNSYFAKLYDVDTRTIKRWIANLVEKGYIKSHVQRNEESIVQCRRLYIIDTPGDRNVPRGGQICPYPGDKNVPPPGDKNVPYNNTSNNNTSSNSSSTTPTTQIVDRWNELDKNIPKIQGINSGTQRHTMLMARINQYSVEQVLQAIDNINQSSFLKGYKTDFVISFDWFIKPNNFIKVLEGNYNDKQMDSESSPNNETDSTNKKESYAERSRRKRLEQIKQGGMID